MLGTKAKKENTGIRATVNIKPLKKRNYNSRDPDPLGFSANRPVDWVKEDWIKIMLLSIKIVQLLYNDIFDITARATHGHFAAKKPPGLHSKPR